MTRSLDDTRCYDRIVHVYFDLGRLQEYCWCYLAMFGIGIIDDWEGVARCNMCSGDAVTYCGKPRAEVSGG